MIMLLKLNPQHLIPGLKYVVREVVDLQKATAGGNVVSLELIFYLSVKLLVLLWCSWFVCCLVVRFSRVLSFSS